MGKVCKIGMIHLSNSLLLKMLDFYPEGRIVGIMQNPNGYIEIVIEHPDMPEVQDGNAIPIVFPIYITTTDALGHKVTLRERKGL